MILMNTNDTFHHHHQKGLWPLNDHPWLGAEYQSTSLSKSWHITFVFPFPTSKFQKKLEKCDVQCVSLARWGFHSHGGRMDGLWKIQWTWIWYPNCRKPPYLQREINFWSGWFRQFHDCHGGDRRGGGTGFVNRWKKNPQVFHSLACLPKCSILFHGFHVFMVSNSFPWFS